MDSNGSTYCPAAFADLNATTCPLLSEVLHQPIFPTLPVGFPQIVDLPQIAAFLPMCSQGYLWDTCALDEGVVDAVEVLSIPSTTVNKDAVDLSNLVLRDVNSTLVKELKGKQSRRGYGNYFVFACGSTVALVFLGYDVHGRRYPARNRGVWEWFKEDIIGLDAPAQVVVPWRDVAQSYLPVSIRSYFS